jgi:signal transduction histidine kinase
MERQRLARKLHDSVSQALFSTTLHARTAERQLAAAGVPPESAAAREVRRVLVLTQGALAEMRALLFELRPGALTDEGLIAALRKQAAAPSARESLPITVTGPDERPPLDPAVEEHLYRIALEAVHNTLKHARASAATVEITVVAGGLTLRVCDDGVGFDPEAVPSGHLGQQTMRDRVAACGASLTVDTAPGHGTRVHVDVPLPTSGEGQSP